MKSWSITLWVIVFFAACTYDHQIIPYSPEETEYHAMVKVDGIEIEKWMNAGINTHNGYSMYFKSYNIQTGIFYEYDFAHIPFLSGKQNLRAKRDSIYGSSTYFEVCCASEPDQINKTSLLYEPDSVNNYIVLHFDTVTREVRGMFKVTYLTAPSEYMHVSCDTFYCKYTIY